MIERTTESSKTERFWYVLYTRPRFEKKVDFALKQKGLHSFLPMRTVVRFWSNGKRKIEQPLFPSYVFVHANLKERYSALQSYGVARFVSFNGYPATIPDEQIQSIYRILKGDYDPQPCEFLDYGDQVEIMSGQLKGIGGFYIEGRGKNKIVISVAAVGQSIAVEVRPDQVKRIRAGVGLGQRC